MLKRYFLLIITCMPFVAFAQQRFAIKGDVKSFKDGEKIFLSYKENGKQHNDSTTVANGAFSFTGTIPGLGEGYLSRNDNPLYAAVLHDNTGTIFIEPGIISVSAADSLIHARITGTPLNLDNTELSMRLLPLTDQWRAVNNGYDALTQSQVADVMFNGPIKNKIDSLWKLMDPIKFEFINTHPNSYVSLITLNRMLNRADPKLVADAYRSLSAANKATQVGQAMAKVIAASARLQIGLEAINFTLKTSTGKDVSLADYRGKYVLVDFWASWCIPCRNENPNVVAAYNKFSGRNFTVLSVSIDNNRAAWLNAIKADRLPWTQALDRPSQSVKGLYGITSIPANVLVAPDGKIVARDIKGSQLHSTLEKLLSK